MAQAQKISIVIPCFNAAGTVDRCLESVVAQTYPHIEIIAVDDCSTDETSAVLQRYQVDSCPCRLRIVRHEVNQGVSASRNDGMAAASGDVVMFLDADDCLLPDCCSHLMAMVETHHADCAACNAWQVMEGRSRRPLFKPEGERVFSGNDYRETVCFSRFFDACWAKVFRLSRIRELGLEFDSSMKYGEDTLFTTCFVLQATRVAVDSGYCGYEYVINPTSCYRTAVVEARLRALRQLLDGLKRQVGGNERLLLRKCSEYLWTIKAFGGDERGRLLNELTESDFWRELAYPVLMQYGKVKHRLLARCIGAGFACAIRFW